MTTSIEGHPPGHDCWQCKPKSTAAWPGARTVYTDRLANRKAWQAKVQPVAPTPSQARGGSAISGTALRVGAGVLGVLLLMATGNVALIGAAFLILVIAAGVRLGTRRR